jgi:flagellar hook-length control protein FliK
MIVTDGPQTPLSSVQPLDQNSAAAAPQTGAADFAALLFLMIGTVQVSPNPVAGESAETLEPLSDVAAPHGGEEVSAGENFTAGEDFDAAEAVPPLSFESPSPAPEGFNAALAEQPIPALSPAGSPMPGDSGGVDDTDATFASATLALRQDSSPAGGEEKSPAPQGQSKIADAGPIVGSWSSQPAGEPLSQAHQFQAVPAGARTVGREKVLAMPERLGEKRDNGSEATSADVTMEATAAGQVAFAEASHGAREASVQATTPGNPGNAENELGRGVSDQQGTPADGGMSRFDSSRDAQPEKTSGAEWNEPHSPFALASSKAYEGAETRAEASARPHDIPISAVPAAPASPSENRAVSPREWRPVIDRVANEIAGHFRVNQHEAIIQLDPPDLGKIKIDLHVQGDKLQAHIIAEAHESHALLENHLQELRQALQAQSLDVVDMRVSHGGLGAGGDPSAGSRQQSHAGEESAWRLTNSPDTAGEGSDAARHDRAQRQAGRVSVWA